MAANLWLTSGGSHHLPPMEAQQNVNHASLSGRPALEMRLPATLTLPMPDALATKRPIGWMLALIATLAVASRLVWFGDQAPDYDEQLYSLIGQRMLAGDLPYVDLWDRKPWGLFALFALAHAVGGPGALAYQVMAALFAVAGAWLVFALARRLVDDVTACGAAIAYPALLYAYGSLAGQSEAFLLPFTLGMMWLVADMPQGRPLAKALAAMLLGGLALQIKTTALPQCVALGLAALWQLRALGSVRLAGLALIFAVLGLLPTALVATWYADQGQFGWFWFALTGSNIARVTDTGERFLLAHLPPLAPLLAVTAGGLYAAWRLNPPRDRGLYRLVCWWSVGVLAGIYLPNHVTVYYFAAFVPCALLLATPLIDRMAPTGWIPLAALLGASALLLNVPRHLDETRMGRASLDRLATTIRPHVGPAGPCLLVFDGPTALYRLTDSCLPSRVVYPDHWNHIMERDSLGIDRMAELRRVLAARPGAIVTGDDPVAVQDPQVQALIQEALAREYRLAASGRIRSRTYHAWVRRDQRS